MKLLLRLLTLFVVAYVTWLLLVFPYDPVRGEAGPWDVQGLLLGLAAALLVTVVASRVFTHSPGKAWNPARWFWAVVYVPVLAYYVVKANLEVAYMVLHPAMPIRPGIVRVKTELRSESGRTALANSITLTPGTFTVDVKPETGDMYIHCLAVKTESTEEATARIVKRFEWFLKRIFD